MRVEIDTVWCKGCELCVHFCPKGVLKIGEVRNAKGYLVPVAANIEACVGCEMCERICPDFCIDVERQ